MTKVVGLDLSIRSTGICSISSDPMSIQLSHVNPPDLQPHLTLFYVVEAIKAVTLGSQLVVIEEEFVYASRGRSTAQLAKLHGAVQVALARQYMDICYVTVAQVRSFFYPHKFKGKIADQLSKRYQDDEVDATVLAQIGLGVLGLAQYDTRRSQLLTRLKKWQTPKPERTQTSF